MKSGYYVIDNGVFRPLKYDEYDISCFDKAFCKFSEERYGWVTWSKELNKWVCCKQPREAIMAELVGAV